MRTFPVLYHYAFRDRVPTGAPASVPWEMLEPHEAQAKRNHDQPLARLAERGGLSPQEMLMVLDDKGWGHCTLATAPAIEELKRRIEQWNSRATQVEA